MTVTVTCDMGGRPIVVLPDEDARRLAVASRRGWVEVVGFAYGYGNVFPVDSVEGRLAAAILTAVAEHGQTESTCGPSDREMAERGYFYGFIIGVSGWDSERQWWAFDVSSPEHREISPSGSLGRHHSGGYQFSG